MIYYTCLKCGVRGEQSTQIIGAGGPQPVGEMDRWTGEISAQSPQQQERGHKTAAGIAAVHICGYDEIGKHAGFRCCHLSDGFAAPFPVFVISKTEYAPVMELVDMRDLRCWHLSERF